MIFENSNQLYDNIVEALKKIGQDNLWTPIDADTKSPKTDSDGELLPKQRMYPFDADDMQAKYDSTQTEEEQAENPINIRISNYNAGTPANPTFQENYVNRDFSGMEGIAEVIGKEMLNYIIDNAEVAMKARMDKLEEDFPLEVTKIFKLQERETGTLDSFMVLIEGNDLALRSEIKDDGFDIYAINEKDLIKIGRYLKEFVR